MIAYIDCNFWQITKSIRSPKDNHSEVIVNQCQGMTYFTGRGSYI